MRIIAAILFSVLLYSCNNFNQTDYEQLQLLIKTIEKESFIYGTINANMIYLKNNNFQVIKSIPLNVKRTRLIKNIHNFYRNVNSIYFPVFGDVDDEYGILYSESGIIDMNGLYKLSRIHGGLFKYSTREW